MKSFNKAMTAVEGVRVGLKAFIFTYLTAFVLSFIINISVIERIQDYLQGTLSESVGFDFGLVIKATSVIMNASVFNASGTIQLGLLIFGALPLFAFYMADRSDNEKEGMDIVGTVIYVIASLVFTLMLTIVSFFTKGHLLGMDINFVSWRNVGMTFIITLLIQVAIGMNYNENRLPGIIATRWMVRLTVGFTSVISVVGILVLLLPYTRSVSLILLMILVLVPNLAVYVFFMMFGVSIGFNEPLQKLLAFANVDLSYAAIPIWARLVLILLFILFALFAITRIDKQQFLKGLIGFGVTFSLISLLMAYCTVIDLGVVRGLMDIRLGINPLQALIFPLGGTMLVGVMYMVSVRLMKTLKE